MCLNQRMQYITHHDDREFNSLKDLWEVRMDLKTHRSTHDSGGDVLSGGAIILEVIIWCGCNQLWEPEIGNLGIEVVVEENIARFDVPVEDGGIWSRVEV